MKNNVRENLNLNEMAEKLNPKGFYPVDFNGHKVYAHGKTEKWAFEILAADEEIAKSVWSGAKNYEGEQDYRKPSNGRPQHDHNVCSPDLKMYEEYKYYGKTKTFFSFFEINGPGHSIKKMNERDTMIAINCLKDNNGLIMVHTDTAFFTEENGEALVKFYKFANSKIMKAAKANYRAKTNKESTFIRASRKRGVEAGMLVDGEVCWTKIADIADFF